MNGDRLLRGLVNGAWIAGGLFLLWSARDLGIGSVDEPGSGFLLVGLGGVLAVTGAAKLAHDLGAKRPIPAATDRTGIRHAVLVAAIFLGYMLVFEPLGFMLATFVLMASLFLVLGRLRIGWAMAGSAAFSGVSYTALKIGLGAQLPPGLLG